jgi:CRP-like cAMP-binding protein
VDTQSELRTHLAEVPIFSRCAPADLRLVADRCEVRSLSAGTTIVRAGNAGEEFFVLLNGTVEVRHEGAVLAKLGPGQPFGELALLDPGPRTADVVATGDVTLGVLTRPKFRLLLEAVPGVAEGMLAFLAHRLREGLEPADPIRL